MADVTPVGMPRSGQGLVEIATGHIEGAVRYRPSRSLRSILPSIEPSGADCHTRVFMFANGPVVVRLAEEEQDELIVAQALRHELRWQRAGLSAPPTQHLLGGRVQVTWPHRRRCQCRVGLAFDTGSRPAHLFGLLVEYGWDSDPDRVRIAEVVWLDRRPALAPAVECFLELTFRALRAQALRAPIGGELGAAIARRPGASTVVAHEVEWAHLNRREHQSTCHVTAQSPRICERDAKVLSSIGAGAWPAPPAITGRLAADVPVEVRNPGEAHRYLLQSGALQRGLFFPERQPPEDADVVIAGAGLAGLATAYALRPRRSLVLEFDDRMAGTAAAGEGTRGPFPLAAHYEHELPTYFGADIIRMHEELGIIAGHPVDGLYPFVDTEYLVTPGRHEQYLDPDGRLWGDVWNLMEAPENIETAKRVAEFIGHMPLPARLAGPEVRDLEALTFADWARDRGLTIGPLLRTAMDTGLRSDYGGTGAQISAFAGIHYLTCRPYLTAEPKTLSPPQGLSYFADKLVEHTPEAEVRLHHLVREIQDHGDHVEVLALDLQNRVTRRVRANHAVFAAPKKSVKWVFPPDRALFRANVYAAWIVVTMEMKRLPEKEMLFWSNGIFDPRGLYVGVTWANHHRPEEPPVIGHYIVFPPGRWHHLPALVDRPRRIVRFCLERLRCLVGRDVSADIERVVIQKLGHAMPTPVPGALFTEPNERRACERILYAGVDCGRLPLLIEAFDSGLEAARRIEAGG